MAPGSEEDLSCPVCHDIFRDPVVLTCSHSFCSDCLQSWWRQKHSRECPVCKAVCSRKKPPVSLVLKNLCEAFLLERDQRAPEDVCSLHSEKLKLFCLDHQQPVCLVCRDSENHTDHKFRPIDEAAQELRRELVKTVLLLKFGMTDVEMAKDDFVVAVDHIESQARRIERQIKEQFKKLHQFLEEEEEARLAALREEEEQKCRVVKEILESVNRELPLLSDTIIATQKQFKAGDVSFLLNYKAVTDRAEQYFPVIEPELPPGALIDEVKHLGNLTYNIWDKMKDMVSYSPVILDPNTAGLVEIVSEDLTTFRGDHDDGPPTPNNPERLYDMHAALGSEGFASGTHSWDVEIGDCKKWELGVVEKSVFDVDEPIGLWCIALNPDGSYSSRSPLAEIEPALRVKKKPQRIRVILNFIAGTLSFSHADTNRRIHTFRHAFDDTMIPYFNVDGTLKILPRKCDTTTC